MQIDLELEPPGAIYRSQVCVLGGGIAGLVLARRLGSAGIKVHLLESGGLRLEERSQRIYEAEMAGDRHAGASEGRFRVFGGSSTRWGGQLLPYTADIFAPSAGMPSWGWPIQAETIEPFYAEVLQMMGADDLPFTAELLHALGHPRVAFGDTIRLRFSKWAPFGRRNVARTLGKACLESLNVTVFTHANAMRLEEVEGSISSAVVRNYAGGEFVFHADQFVVCMGTIESSRLLLESGVGNKFGQVGRYFHDHLSVRVAAVEGAARTQILDRLGPFVYKGTMHTCKLEASAEMRERDGMQAVMAHVVIEEPDDSGVAAVRELLRSLQRGDLRAASRNLLPVLRGVGDVARLAWGSAVRGRRSVSARAKVWLHIDMEQVARSEDRIRLAESDGTRDALGQRRVIVDWRVGDTQRETARRYAEVVQAELEAAGIAGLRWLEDGMLKDTFHPMGGLRMGNDPRTSVVDPDLRVHGVANLFMVSCGVFPAGGSSNPTFTMMALALRLGQRLGPL